MKGYKGIPKQHHEATKGMIAAFRIAYRKQLSPKAAYAKWQEAQENKAKKEKETGEKDRQSRIQEQRANHAKLAQQALVSLATVRDTLFGIAHDRLTYLQTEDFAQMAHALMVQAGSDLEEALFICGMVKADKHGGFFTERFPKLEK